MNGSEERDPLSAQVLGAAIEVHKLLGPGLLESVYQKALCHELLLRGIPFAALKEVPVNYKGVDLGEDLKLDILVADRLVLELKAVESLLARPPGTTHHIPETRWPPNGLLINFNVRMLKDGVKRVVL